MGKAENINSNEVFLDDLPWERRWYVVSMGKTAEQVLDSKDFEINEKSIKETIKFAKNKLSLWYFFGRGAATVRNFETDEMAGNYQEELSEIQVKNRINQELEDKYNEIDLDPKRNYSFLDSLLLSNVEKS